MTQLFSRHHRRGGFTLVELIVYVGLSTIVVVASLNILVTILGTRDKSSVGTVVQQNLRYVLDRMTVTARSAIGINTGTSVFNSDTGTLSFAMSGTTINPTVYSYCGGHVCVKEGAGPMLLLTGSGMTVDQFRLTNLTPSGGFAVVKVQLHGMQSVVDANPPESASFSLQSSFMLRQ